MFEKFLVAIDFSEDSRVALLQAAVVARVTHPKSFVLGHALVDFRKSFMAMPSEARMELVAGDMDKFQRGLRAEAELQLGELTKELSITDLPLKKEVFLSTPYISLIEAVLKEKHDLVFVGSRGITGFKGFFIGSTAKQLVRNCPCAVWLSRGIARDTPKAILVPVDFSSVSLGALEIGNELAQHLNAELHVMHVIDEDDIPDDLLEGNGDSGKSLPGWREQVENKARDKLDQFVNKIAPKQTSDRYTLWGEPWEEISKNAKRVGADLVVMGTIGRRGINRLLLGNTAEKVLESCETSILSIKPKDFICPIDMPCWSLHPEDKE